MDIEREVIELRDRVAALEAVVMGASATASAAAVATVAPTDEAGARSVAPPPPDFGAAQTFPPPPPGAVPTFTAPPPGAAPSAQPAEPALPSFDWGIESVLRWAGVVLVTLAGIFLVSTAISRGWIGPELQLLGAALGGAAMLAAAIKLSDSRRPWALALGCGGAVVLAACALATHEWLDVVGPGPAVVLAALATAISVAVALETRLEGVALVAALVGMIAPIETLSQFGDGAILGWVAAFIVGATALGLVKTWPGVRMLTSWLGALVLLSYALSEEVEGALQVMGFVGAAVIAVALWTAPTLAWRLTGTSGSGSWGSFDWTPIDYRLVALVPAWVWAVVAGLLPLTEDKEYGLVAIITAAGFVALAEATFGRVERLVSISTFFGAFSLLAVGFAVFFEGPALMVALAGQAATSYYLAHRLDDGLLRFTSYAVGAAATALAVYEMLEALGDDGFANVGYALATGLIVLCWIGAALELYDRDDLEIDFEPPLVGAWAGSMLWLAAALLAAPQGLVLVSVAWTVMACAGLILGLTQRLGIVRNLAMATLGITLFKLVTVDMAEVDVFWRVGLFFVVGMGLIALGLKVPSLVGPEPDELDGPADAEPVTTF